MNNPSLSEIKALFYYVEGEWCLRRLVNQSRNAKSGEIAGHVNKLGYRIVKINKQSYKAHRLLYRMYNEIEELDSNVLIDHIDGNKENNSPQNLRLATCAENQHNSHRRLNNKSGHKNILTVNWKSGNTVNRYWRIDIASNGERYVKDFPYEFPLPEYIIKHASEMRSLMHGDFANE